MGSQIFSRRQFLRVAALSLGGMALRPWLDQPASRLALPDVPIAEKIGRVLGGKVEVKARPDEDSPTVRNFSEDSLVVWLAEGIGSRPLWNDQRYVETPEGYIYAANLQPVRNLPNQPLAALPDPQGMWVEVTVPYVDLAACQPASAFSLAGLYEHPAAVLQPDHVG